MKNPILRINKPCRVDGGWVCVVFSRDGNVARMDKHKFADEQEALAWAANEEALHAGRGVG